MLEIIWLNIKDTRPGLWSVKSLPVQDTLPRDARTGWRRPCGLLADECARIDGHGDAGDVASLIRYQPEDRVADVGRVEELYVEQVRGPLQLRAGQNSARNVDVSTRRVSTVLSKSAFTVKNGCDGRAKERHAEENVG